ncbi:MAG: hypothetical protein H6Q61_233 [Firmicutes bacterium]|nr:hypothetical protein [Bacillota bacterium]
MKKLGIVLFLIGLVTIVCGATAMLAPSLLPINGGLTVGCGTSIFGYGSIILMGLYLNEPAPEA